MEFKWEHYRLVKSYEWELFLKTFPFLSKSRLGEIVLNLGIALRAPNNGKSNSKKAIPSCS